MFIPLRIARRHLCVIRSCDACALMKFSLGGKQSHVLSAVEASSQLLSSVAG